MALSAAEQYLLELINRARLDPLAEAARYNLNLNAGLSPGEISSAAKQILAPNEVLETAAIRHSTWMLETNTFSHTGINSSDPGGRMESAGYSFTGTWTWRENLAWIGSTRAIDMAAAIDEHHEGLYRSAGHRLNSFTENAREVGLAQVSGTFNYQGTNFNSSMLTENFAASGDDVFISGVAYVDTDGNDFYSIGEGRSGTWVRGGGDIGKTTGAGGYAIEVDAGDTVRVAVGKGQNKLAQLDLDMSDGNVKLDVVTNANGGKMLALSGSAKLISGIKDVVLLGSADLDLVGSTAANTVDGNRGDNRIEGRSGSDVLFGHDGNDRLDGGGGNDKLFGGSGKDDLFGRSGDDKLTGGGGNDRLWGGGHKDILDGQSGNDRLEGGLGNDALMGRSGNDLLLGGGGRDRMFGGDGADRLNGGSGSDRMSGGAGADTFVFTGGVDKIVDFQDNVDEIQLRGSLNNLSDMKMSEVLDFGEIVNGDAVFDFGNHALTIIGVDDLSILANDLVII